MGRIACNGERCGLKTRFLIELVELISTEFVHPQLASICDNAHYKARNSITVQAKSGWRGFCCPLIQLNNQEFRNGT